MVPAIQKQLVEKTKHLRILERDRTVKRAEILRLNQLMQLVEDETSVMEKALLLFLRQMMDEAKVTSVDELSWIHTEMVLRRVFITMNMMQQVRVVREPFKCSSAKMLPHLK